MRIAIFGGSFDPVHKEHIGLVKAAMKSLRLDRVLVTPACAPPHKKGKILASDKDRIQMCRLAFEGIEGVEISDYEIAKGGVSYTYQTCEYFRTIYPEAEIFWLVGTDMLRDFPTWKYPERIVNAVTLGVCARDEKVGWAQKERAVFRERFGCDFSVIDYNGAPVSSTQIRVLAGAGMRVTQYTNENVAAYIHGKKLYAIPFAPAALALEKQSRQEHSLRVARVAAEKAPALGVDERKAIAAALFHDCAKNLSKDDPLLSGFALGEEWGEVPDAVYHQFAGAYVAENVFAVRDGEILGAIRFHTSGKAAMTELEKLVFLSDMIEEERRYDGVEILRELFWNTPKKGAGALDACLARALKETVSHLRQKGEKIYPLTLQAYEYYKENL